MRTIYNILLLLLSPIILFLLIKEGIKNNRRLRRFGEYFGIPPHLSTGRSPLWIHAVSVGESIAAIPLIKALKKANPDQPIVVTTTTTAGAEQIAKLGKLAEHRYMPVDFCFAISAFLKIIKPEKMLIIETELWPNTLHCVNQAGIPITIVNARLSERSCKGYAKIRPVFNLLSKNITKILCQSEADAQRFQRLGVAKNKLAVTGSIKFDIQVSDQVIQQGKELRLFLGKERPVWIAASTHKGEDEQILEAHKCFSDEYPDALLILVPRHPERFNSVYNLCHEYGFNTVKRQSTSTIPENTQVYLGDTMGEMLTLLGAADVCFMGGSMLGNKVGGHNVLEPATLGIPILTGPSYFNFKTVTEDLIANQAIFICENTGCISQELSYLIKNTDKRAKMTLAAKKVISHNQGAISRTISYIKEPH
jgi:3-deoxy-D-manno-octulosonic-acid transferase